MAKGCSKNKDIEEGVTMRLCYACAYKHIHIILGSIIDTNRKDFVIIWRVSVCSL